MRMSLIGLAILAIVVLVSNSMAYTRGVPDSSAIPGKHNPKYNSMTEKLFYYNGVFRNLGDIIIESRAQQGAKVLGHGLVQKVEMLGSRISTGKYYWQGFHDVNRFPKKDGSAPVQRG